MDEFEKRMHMSSFISTLCDAVSKMNPAMLVDENARKMIDAAQLGNQLQGANKQWLDMLQHFIGKADTLGSKYPIEELLGIKVDTNPTPKV